MIAHALPVLFAAAAAAPAFISQIPAIYTTPPTWPSEAGAAPPRRSSDVTGVTSHGPFSGTATTTGAEQAPTTLSFTMPAVPVPTQDYYNADGKLKAPAQMPFLPGGMSKAPAS